MRVLLVDDEPPALERLQALFSDLPDVEVVGAARDSAEAVDAIERLSPDLVMLDIQMPGRSGLAMAAGLPTERRPEIVFVTAFEHYAPDAFEVEAADYLLKPLRLDRLRQAVERAKRRRALKAAAELAAQPAPPAETEPSDSRYEDAIWVQVRGGVVRVPVESIDWIEAAKDYVLLHTRTRTHIHRSTMSALEKRIDPAQLMRVHRSAFVRLELVAEVQRLGKGLIALVLHDGARVQVSPNYVKAVAGRLKLAATD